MLYFIMVLQGLAQGERERLRELSLEELLQVEIVSATNQREAIVDAPATVLVLSQEDLQRRGYSELSQILDDLPGMQVSRSYGDFAFKNYWRGYRNYPSDPFLLLIDGIKFNDLYSNNAETPLAAFPLLLIERVEVVYGPASALYGPDAHMGIIQIITRKPDDAGGQSFRLLAGSNSNRKAEFLLQHEGRGARLSVAGRWEDFQLDDRHLDGYEFTRNEYYLDRRLWGGFLDNPRLAGPFQSQNRRLALDFRLSWKNVQMGSTYLRQASGYGSEYAADRAQANGKWARELSDIHLKVKQRLSEKIEGSLTLRSFRNVLLPDSYFVEGYFDPSQQEFRVAYSWWHIWNQSYEINQTMFARLHERLQIQGGIEYKWKDLDKAGNNPYGPFVPVEALDSSTYPFPPEPPATTDKDRVTTETASLYGQLRLHLGKAQSLLIGGRIDHNSNYGNAKTLRLGYLTNRPPFVLKLLYGQGFLEPTPRVLYGGWSGSGGDPNLKPETSQTFELCGSRTKGSTQIELSIWSVESEDMIVGTAPSALNAGERQVRGLDLHGAVKASPEGLDSLNLWAFYSHVFHSSGHNLAAQGNAALEGLTREGAVGDLAKDQLKLGVSASKYGWSASALARYVGPRATVATNPLGSIDGYLCIDLILEQRAVFGIRAVDASLRIANLGNAAYGHPGYAQANAGDQPGYWDASGYHGSGGYYSSKLMQPGREFQFALQYRFPQTGD